MAQEKLSEKEIDQISREFSEKLSSKLQKSGVSVYWEHEDRVYQMLRDFLLKKLKSIIEKL